jgi:DivIVA domain-containing protein
VVTALALLGVVLLLLSAALLSTRDGEVLADAPQDLPDLELPDRPLQPQDVEHVRFSLAPRGYRMSEVDAVLDRLAAELADATASSPSCWAGPVEARPQGLER